MAKFDVYHLDVTFQDKRASKFRYAVVIDDSETYVLLLNSITSQYKEKSDYIQLQYYPIVDWKAANLKKASYVDIRSAFKRSFSELLSDAQYVGCLSKNDQEGLLDFILTYPQRLKEWKAENIEYVGKD